MKEAPPPKKIMSTLAMLLSL